MYITLTKKKIAIILCCLVLGFILLGQFFSAKAYGVDVSTNEKRVQYIATLGLSLQSDNFTQKEVTIPEEFGAVYNNYNSLQREAGFDLSNYRGKRVTVYTYSLDSQRQVSLIVFKDKLIGGDIASLKIDGQMTALR